MNQKLLGLSFALLVVFGSVAVMIAPTFFTKGVSRIELTKAFDLPHILNEEKEIEFLFFGYSGCRDICTPRLEAIATFYKTMDADLKKSVGLVFIDISSPEDRELPERFAAFFEKDFRGVYLPKAHLREYTRVFDIFFAQSLRDSTEYDHTANLYIVKKKSNTKEIRYIYTAYPYDFKQIKLDIEELINESANKKNIT